MYGQDRYCSQILSQQANRGVYRERWNRAGPSLKTAAPVVAFTFVLLTDTPDWLKLENENHNTPISPIVPSEILNVNLLEVLNVVKCEIELWMWRGWTWRGKSTVNNDSWMWTTAIMCQARSSRHPLRYVAHNSCFEGHFVRLFYV